MSLKFDHWDDLDGIASSTLESDNSPLEDRSIY